MCRKDQGLSGPSPWRRQESNPGEADRSQKTHTHTLGELQSARRELSTALSRRRDVFLWTTWAVKFKSFPLFFFYSIKKNKAPCVALLLPGQLFLSVETRSNQVCALGTRELDQDSWFPVGPESLEPSEARLHATFSSFSWCQRSVGEDWRLAAN